MAEEKKEKLDESHLKELTNDKYAQLQPNVAEAMRKADKER